MLALDGALDLVRLKGQVPDATANKLRRLSQWLATVMKSGFLLQAAADAFGLDVVHLNAESHVYQIGQGARGFHFEQASNERDALTGAIVARNKRLTTLTLRKFGFPVPRGELVSDERQAGAAITRIGFPCVVKPVSMDKGTGVATSLKTEAQVIAAVAHAKRLSSKAVLIENHIEGVDHRMMVAGGELLWAYRKDPASLYGDGKATVAQLIERENRNRAEIRSGSEVYRYPIITDDAFEHFLTGRYGIGSETVLPAGTGIEVAPQANIARGGLLKDVTGSVHPDNRMLAIRTARLLRLHTAGIDFMTPDISRSWKEIDCAIIEINGAPGISGMGDASLLLRTSFPNRLTGRIPTVVVIGDMDFRTRSAEVVRAAFIAHGLCLRVADYGVGSGKADGQHFPLAQTVETLLLDPEAEAALIACGPGEVERWGLPVRHCPLLIVQGDAPPEWLARRAGAVLAAGVSRAEIENAVTSLARRYVDPAEGGPRPVLEPLGPYRENEYRLRVWRVRSAPKAWFWGQVGLKAPNPDGLITQDDLL
ncbi:MAG TPA: acetate--CoA ligase family protein, partial [Opitutus sp.]|nr:acetate--CoA ligase family protein [Opitutus sp.]